MIDLASLADTFVSNIGRTALTLLGLVAGVAAVVSIQILGADLAGAIDESLGQIGDRTFIVSPRLSNGARARAVIKKSDLPMLLSHLSVLSSVIPAGGHSEITRVGHLEYRVTLYPDDASSANRPELMFGRLINQDDVQQKSAVCVLSNKAYMDLFGSLGVGAIGRSVYLGTKRYVVIGAFRPRRLAIININFAGDLAVPYTVYEGLFARSAPVGAIRVTAASSGSISEVEKKVIDEINKIHNTPAAKFEVFDRVSASRQVDKIVNAVTLAISFIGAVSLLVAGIGIMNIMLISVAERVREIGLRMAIGARRGQIVLQFLAESLTIASCGSLLGLLFGLLIGWLANRFIIVALTGYVGQVPWQKAALLAVSFAVGLTLLFGTYPAYRASKLDPIVALRRE